MDSTTTSDRRAPQIGDIVLYHCQDAGRLHALAALVTHVEQPDNPRSPVFLTVFRAGRAPEPHNSAIPHATEPVNGYWSWRPGA